MAQRLYHGLTQCAMQSLLCHTGIHVIIGQHLTVQRNVHDPDACLSYTPNPLLHVMLVFMHIRRPIHI